MESNTVKIAGIIVAHNEWPLLGISIAHAMENVVDEVWVLDHNSTDETAAGLRRLQNLWGEYRFHIVRANTVGFYQEALTNLMVQMAYSSNPDWIYVFDADEFMLSDEGTLRSVLMKLPADVAAVRYEVENFVSVSDFNDRLLSDYRRLRYRSVPSLFLDLDHETAIDEIQSGTLSFFDLIFRPKLIFRASQTAWVAAGAHSLRSDTQPKTLVVGRGELRAAHFPLLSETRLLLRVSQGLEIQRAGFPLSHGWQSQMIYGLHKENRLKQFWAAHSLQDREKSHPPHPWPVVEDDLFIRSIDRALNMLEANSVIYSDETETRGVPTEDTVALHVTVKALARQQHAFDRMEQDLRTMRADLTEKAARLVEMQAISMGLKQTNDAESLSETMRFATWLSAVVKKMAPRGSWRRALLRTVLRGIKRLRGRR
jgi:hypothetical protein